MEKINEKEFRIQNLEFRKDVPKSHILNSLFLFLLLYSIFYFLNPFAAEAASLYFSPSSGSYEVGRNFSVSIFVSSLDQAMNAVSGTATFETDKLEAVSVSKAGSIINLWVQEPSFSNAAGIVNLEGIVLNPGYTGSAGKILNVSFKPKAEGTTSLSFSSGSVLANDGLGTNILSNLGSAQFNLKIGKSPILSESVKEEEVLLPQIPKVYSSTHPDQEKWYNNNRPKFAWDLTPDITAIRVLYDKNADSRPNVVYQPAISEKQIEEEVKDGIYYFHIQFRNRAGWGPIAHFKFQIDTVPPEEVLISFKDGRETKESRPLILISFKDALSGTADYSELRIGNGDWFSSDYETGAEFASWPHLVRLPFQNPGKYPISVKVFDKAGNFAVKDEEFSVKPIIIPEAKKELKFLKIGSILISYLSLVILLAGLILFLMFILWYIWQKFFGFKKRVLKEALEAERALHHAIVLLKADIAKQVKFLERTKLTRKLTKEEDGVLEQLKKDLDDFERFVGKEIKDIEELR